MAVWLDLWIFTDWLKQVGLSIGPTQSEAKLQGCRYSYSNHYLLNVGMKLSSLIGMNHAMWTFMILGHPLPQTLYHLPERRKPIGDSCFEKHPILLARLFSKDSSKTGLVLTGKPKGSRKAPLLGSRSVSENTSHP